MFQTFFEIAFVKAAIRPIVFSKTVKLSIEVVALIEIASDEFLRSFAVFDEAGEISFISTCFAFCIYAEACCFAFDPLADIGVSCLADPHSASVFIVIPPLTFIHLSLRPNILSLAIHFVLEVLSLIDTAVGENLVPIPMSLVCLPLSVVALSIMIKHDPFSFSFPPNVLSVVGCFLVLFKSEALILMKLSHV
jgi:hypothetical protein